MQYHDSDISIMLKQRIRGLTLFSMLFPSIFPIKYVNTAREFDSMDITSNNKVINASQT